MNDIEKFDPSKLMNGVRERVKATFVALIPDEQWDMLCKKEIENFFALKEVSNNNRKFSSDFRELCFAELREQAVNHIKKHLVSDKGENRFDGQWGHIATPLLTQLIQDNANAIFASMLKEMFQDVIQRMQSRSY